MHAIAPTLNTEYVRSRLFEFARRQKLRQTVYEAGQILINKEATIEDYERVEHLLSGVANFQAAHYDLGFSMANTERSLAFLNPENEKDELKIGITELDDAGIIPRKKEVLLFLGPPKHGKSMWLHHIGKAGFNRGWRVLHISLENSDVSTSFRYVQSQFGLTKHVENPALSYFDKDDLGKLVGMHNADNYAVPMYPNGEDRETVNARWREYLDNRIRGSNEYRYSNLWIASFDTGELSFEKYEAFMDQLAIIERFVPDLVVLDYPYLMDFSQNDARLAYGKLTQKLRGSARRRNYALCIVSQQNRKGEVAEDYSQVMTCDYGITYQQTQAEYELGLARLFVNYARNERGRFTVLISQNYAASHFAVDSARMVSKSQYDQIIQNTSADQEVPDE
jgi:hypothetical protein